MPPAVTFTPHQSSPLARTPQPKGSSSPPCAPANISKNPWGEDERQLIVIQKRRDTICSNSTLQTPKSAQRYSSDTVLGIIKSYGPNSPRVPYPSPSTETSSRVDVGLCTPRTNPIDSASGETVAICRTCKEPSTSSIGVCRQCRTATMIPSPFADASTSPTITTATPPASTTHNDLTSTNLRLLESAKLLKGKHRRPSIPSLQLNDPPIRLSPLRSPSWQPDSPPFSREQSHQLSPSAQDLGLSPMRFPVAHPSSPSTPPSTANSYHNSLNTPPYSLAHIRNPSESLPGYNPHRHVSITSSTDSNSPFLSGLALSPTPTTPSTAATSLRRESRASSYGLQHTMSAWDEWDSEEEEEKAGLVKYWRGRRWRGSGGSLRGSGIGRRESVGNEEVEQGGSGVASGSVSVSGSGRKRRGFVRVISCGCVGG